MGGISTPSAPNLQDSSAHPPTTPLVSLCFPINRFAILNHFILPPPSPLPLANPFPSPFPFPFHRCFAPPPPPLLLCPCRGCLLSHSPSSRHRRPAAWKSYPLSSRYTTAVS